MADRLGPFDAYLSEYDKMRASANVEDRTNDPWPWHSAGPQEPQQTMRDKDALDLLIAQLRSVEIPPATRLGLDAGIHDIGPLSKEEVLKYLMTNASTGPDPVKGAK